MMRDRITFARRMTLDLADRKNFSCVTELLRHLDLDIEVATDALADMLGQRDQWLPLLEQGNDRDLLELNLQRAIEADLLCLSSLMPTGWAEQLAPAARLAAATLSEIKPDHALIDLLDWEGDTFRPEVECLSQWRALADLLLTGSGTLRKALNKNNGCPPQSEQKKYCRSGLPHTKVTRRLPGLKDYLRLLRHQTLFLVMINGISCVRRSSVYG